MANEAQALAGEPQGAGDSEYEALLSVLSSSARGRAFLDEHARRNRQADTEMLLDALARIEAMLAEQRAEMPTLPPAPPAFPPAAPAATALAAIAAQAMAAAENDLPAVTVIKAGSMPPPSPFAGEDFATAEAAVEAPAPPRETPDPAAESNVIADSVPAEHAAPPGTPVADALAALLALSDEERLALFS